MEYHNLNKQHFLYSHYINPSAAYHQPIFSLSSAEKEYRNKIMSNSSNLNKQYFYERFLKSIFSRRYREYLHNSKKSSNFAPEIGII